MTATIPGIPGEVALPNGVGVRGINEDDAEVYDLELAREELPGVAFLDRNIIVAGLYNVSWFSVDNNGNEEAVDWIGTLIVVLKMLIRTTDSISRAGLKFIAGGQFSILLTFVVDTLATVFSTDVALYPVFLYSIWLFPLAGAFLYYLGWIMPDWLKKALTKGKG